MSRYLNLGCGSRFIASWTNVDFTSTAPGVMACNLVEGVPFADNSFAAVYHSHVLEHFSRPDGEKFIRECFRVLAPGGVIRVVVSDLERIAQSYLHCLNEAVKNPELRNAENYRWSMLELVDQLARHQPGGEMLPCWKQQEIVNEDFLVERMGHEFLSFRERMTNPKPAGPDQNESGSTSTKQKPRIPFVSRVKNKLTRLLRDRVISAEERKYLEVGKVRLTGEVHQWMYDRFSLPALLESVGFEDAQPTRAEASRIPGWEAFKSLDLENGRVRKPDSLFVEAIK